MALTPNPSDPSRAPAEARVASSLPGFLFAAGLVLVFLGQRVLAATVVPQAVATVVGVGALLVAVIQRVLEAVRARAESRKIARILALSALGGTVAILLALATSSMGTTYVGLDRLDPAAREHWDGILGTAWVSLLTISLFPLLMAETALWSMRRAPQPESRRVLSAAMAGLTLGLCLIYSSLFVYTAGKWGVAVDYAYFKTAQPSASTRKIAASLKEPIRVVAVFPSVNEVRNEVSKYLAALMRGNKKIQVEYQDRLLNPKLARELRVSQDGVLVFSRGEVRHLITIGTDLKKARNALRTLDQDVQKNLLKLARDTRVVYLTVGHGEINDSKRADDKRDGRTTQIIKKLLEMQNYRLLDLGLPQGLGRAVPEDADLVMILGPTEPFAPEEVKALEAYAKAGGHFLVALDPQAMDLTAGAEGGAEASEETAPSSSGEPLLAASTKPAASAKGLDAGKPARPAEAEGEKPKVDAEAAAAALGRGGLSPNLEELAGLFGLVFEPTLLANSRQYLQRQFNKSDRIQLVTNRFSSHASVSTLSRNASWAVLFGAGSLTKANPDDKGIDFALRAVSGTFADKNGDFEKDAGEEDGDFNFAAAVVRPVGEGAPPPPKDKEKDKEKDKKDEKNKAQAGKKEMRAFVLADADALSDLVLFNVPTNRLLLVDAVRWLGGEESFAGEVNNEEDHRIEHTKDQDVIWFYATIFGAPLLVLGLGLAWARRSRRKGAAR